jgi:hypothetical protein
MHTFTDNLGRSWSIEITPYEVEQLRGHELKLDLLEAAVPDKSLAFYERMSDRVVLTRVLYVLLADQLEKNLGPGKTAAEYGRDFAKGLGGDVLDAAALAFEAALYDFFPKPQRPRLRAAAGKIREIEAKTEARQIALIGSPQVEDLIEKTMSKAEAAALDHLDKYQPPTSGE